MTARRPAREMRTPTGRRSSRPVVAVTAAASPAGRAVVEALRRLQLDLSVRNRPKRVIAIDSRPDPARSADAGDPPDSLDLDAGDPGPIPATDWHEADVTSPQIADSLTGVDVVVHVATADDLATSLALPTQERRARAIRAAQAVTTAAAAVGARRLIVVTSAMVFGARADNPVPLVDDAPGRADADDGLVGDLLEIERVLERTPRVHPGLALTVIRPAALVGPGVDSAVTRHFEAPRLLTIRGASTRWQFCHVDDLAAAVSTVLDVGLDGWLNAGSDGSLGAEDVERLSGMRRLEVPSGLAFSTAERLHRVGVLPTPAGELAYVVHPWVVDSAGLLAAGWAPSHGNEDCLRELIEVAAARRTATGRRVDRREAAMGAAGAAVALLGTAAILRQARSRQSRRRRPTLEA